MTDIGDDVTIPITVKVAGALTDPASIEVHTTAPDGTEDTLTPARLSLGTYEAHVAATAGGRWLYRVVTVDPDHVEHSYFDVAANPPPPARLMPLATVADLEARYGTLTDDQRARADALLADASAKIRVYTGQNFDLTLGDVITLRPVGTTVRLPQRPVRAVHQVVAVGGTSSIPDITLPSGAWTWDGIDLVDVWPTNTGWILNLPEVWLEGYPPDTYRITYDHGYDTTPDDVIAVCCSMALRVLTSPTQVEGLQSERIGQYSYQYGQGAGGQSPGLTPRLTDADREDLQPYRATKRASTIALRVR